MKNIKDMNISELNAVLDTIAAKEAKKKSLTSLESFQKDMIPLLIAEKEKAEKLTERLNSVKTSTVRQPKATDNKADMLLEIFKALKSFVNHGDTKEHAIKIFADTAKALNIPVNADTVKALINPSIFHNSKSNIAKTENNKKPVTYEHCQGMADTFYCLLVEADILTGKKLAKADFENMINTVIAKSAIAIKDTDKKALADKVLNYFKPAK